MLTGSELPPVGQHSPLGAGPVFAAVRERAGPLIGAAVEVSPAVAMVRQASSLLHVAGCCWAAGTLAGSFSTAFSAGVAH